MRGTTATHACSRLLGAVVLLVAACMAVPALAGAASVEVVGSTTTVRPTDDPAGTGSAVLTAARNEFESFQVVVHGGSSGGLANMAVRLLRPLSNTAGGTIPATNVTIYREAYYDVRTASDGELGGALGRFPDALIPAVDPWYREARTAFPITVPSGENRVAWIDVQVPAGQAAGVYTGALEVVGDGFRAEVPVQLTVAGFTLPATSTLRGAFDLNTNGPCQVHSCANGAGWSVISLYTRVALDNRVSIAKPSYVTPTAGSASTSFRQWVQPMFAGTSAARVPGARLTDTIVYQWCATCVGAWKAEGAAGGFADRISFHCDEVGRSVSMWASCRDSYNTASAQWNATAPAMGRLPLEVTATVNDVEWAKAYRDSSGGAPIAGVAASVDVVDPVVNRLDDKVGEYQGSQASRYASFVAGDPARRKAWAYTSCMSHGCVQDSYWNASYWNGWPSYAIDQPASEARAMPWVLFAKNFTGEYYFETVKSLGSAWSNQFSEGGNGDGTLFYPGLPAGGANSAPAIGGLHPIPIESIRLKRIRDGREDYEYLTFLARNGKAAEAKSAASALFPSPYQTNVTQARLDSARQGLLQHIATVTGGWTSEPTPTPEPDPTPGDAPTCNGLVATIVGTSAADSLQGTAAADVIVGLGGNDVIAGGGGNDTICGGDGYDVMSGGAGGDRIDGGASADLASFRSAARGVTVNLATGAASGEGGDVLVAVEDVGGSRFGDAITGNAANNYVTAGAGADIISGGGGNDYLTGLSGADIIAGGPGNDRILGGDAADRITGGLGSDAIEAGAGDDVIRVLDGARDSVLCGLGRESLRADAFDGRSSCR